MAKAAKSTSFADILDKPASEIERPKPLPAGTYTCVVKGQPQHGKSSQKQTPFVEFTLGILAAGEDIDEDELKAALTKADGTVVPLTDKTIKQKYYITEGSAFMLKDFLESCGLDTEGDASTRQLLEETPGCQMTVTLKHEASNDGQSIFARVAGTAKID